MSVLSQIESMLRAGGISSVESLTAMKKGREALVTNLTAKLGEGVTPIQEAINQVIGKAQVGMAVGAAIERGETVLPSLYPVDPTLPQETKYRYRVLVTTTKASPFRASGVETLTVVVPVDSDTELSRRQAAAMAEDAVRKASPESTSPKLKLSGEVLRTQTVISVDTIVISAYRSTLE